MNKKRQVIIVSIVIVAIASISIYIEFIMKPQNPSMNPGKVSPFAVYMHSNLSILMDGNQI